MAKLSEKIIKNNGYSSKITVINKNSRDIELGKDIKEKADLLVTEIFDTDLIGEGILPTLRHAIKYLLKENAVIIPSYCTLEMSLVSSSFLWRMHSLDKNHLEKQQVKFDCKPCIGNGQLLQLNFKQLKQQYLEFASNSHIIHEFEFNESFDFAGDIKSKQVNLKVINEGISHGLLTYWTIYLDSSRKISISTNFLNEKNMPYKWKDHWVQSIIFFNRPIHLKKDQVLSLNGYHDDYNHWVTFDEDAQEISQSNPTCRCLLHNVLSNTRISQLNDPKNLALNSISNLTQSFHKFVIISGFSLLPCLLAGDEGNFVSHLMLNSNSYSIKLQKELIDQNCLTDKIKVINFNDITKLTDCDLFEKSEYIICEMDLPFSTLPWHNLFFWNLTTNIIKHSINIRFFPDSFSIKFLPVCLPEMWINYTDVSRIEQFELSLFDNLLHNANRPKSIKGKGLFSSCQSISMFDQKWQALSYPTSAIDINLYKDVVCDTYNCGSIDIKRSDYFDAIIIWIEFYHDNKCIFNSGINNYLLNETDIELLNSEKIGFNHYCKQAIWPIRRKSKDDRTIIDGREQSILFDFFFDSDDGECYFDFRSLEK